MSEARILPIPAAQWSDEMWDAIAVIGAKRPDPNAAPGPSSNILGIYANHPPLVTGWMPFSSHLKHSALSDRVREMAIVRTTWLGGGEYEWAQHRRIAKNAGLSDAEINALSDQGEVAYPPLSGLQYSPGVGVDYYIWALQLSGLGTTLTGVNFLATVLKMRAPGMKLMDMPIFTWTCTWANVLIVASFPILTATLALLTLDRYMDFHIFTNELGGNPMMYVNLFWAWGHPEVYILILPAFGIFSEVISTFTGKRLFGHHSMVYASGAISVLGFMVWLHHFFTMGSGASVNAFFGLATMLISIPTGVKLFNWLFTIYRGRLQFTSQVLWTLGFMVTFAIGGMTGVLLAIPGADFVLHNSLFVIAHFHNVIIGGAVFGYIAGFSFYFPKAFGFKLNEKWGKAAFWFWIVGFFIAFMPLYALGFMGMTRRLNATTNPEWVLLVLRLFSSVLSVRSYKFWFRSVTVNSCATIMAIHGKTAVRWNGQHPHLRHSTISRKRRSFTTLTHIGI